jgi:hypothetical protein
MLWAPGGPADKSSKVSYLGVYWGFWTGLFPSPSKVSQKPLAWLIFLDCFGFGFKRDWI